MRCLISAALTVTTILSTTSTVGAPLERSFVGKKLQGITFVDTEGHTIDPRHYAGSVLVMIAGIPW